MKIFVLLLFIILLLTDCNKNNKDAAGRFIKVELPPAPPYSSKTQPSDSGTVKPIKKSEKKIRIAFLCLENSPYWNYVKDGTFAAQKELEDYNAEVDWVVPPGDRHTAEVFGNSLDALVVQQYDAIATVAGDSGIIPYINRAVDAGIPVATFNVETKKPSKRLFFVGADLYSQGQDAGKAFVEYWLGKKIDNPKVAILTGFFAVEGHELRREGFLDYIKENAPKVQVVGQVETKDNDEIGYQLASDFITANPDLNAMYGTAAGTIGVARAIEETGLTGKVFLFAFDYYPQLVEYVRKGVIALTIGQQPFAQGHDPVIRLFNYLVAGEAPPAGILNTKSTYLNAENIDSVVGSGGKD